MLCQKVPFYANYHHHYHHRHHGHSASVDWREFSFRLSTQGSTCGLLTLVHLLYGHGNSDFCQFLSGAVTWTIFSLIAHSVVMYHFVFGINFQIHSGSFTNFSSIRQLVRLSSHFCHHHHSQHPSLLHSFTPGSKPIPFQQILPTLTDLWYPTDCLHGSLN